MKEFCALLLITAAAVCISAPAKYWIGGATGDPSNWSNSGNWSATSGGAGGADVPGTGDSVVFDANSNSSRCSLTTDVSVFMINSLSTHSNKIVVGQHSVTVATLFVCASSADTPIVSSGSLRLSGSLLFWAYGGRTVYLTGVTEAVATSSISINRAPTGSSSSVTVFQIGSIRGARKVSAVVAGGGPMVWSLSGDTVSSDTVECYSNSATYACSTSFGSSSIAVGTWNVPSAGARSNTRINLGSSLWNITTGLRLQKSIVVYPGSSIITISGNATLVPKGVSLNRLRFSPGITAVFTAADTVVIGSYAGDDWCGNIASILRWRSSADGSPYYLSAPGGSRVQFINVRDCANYGSTISAWSSVDSGGNSGWAFYPRGKGVRATRRVGAGF